MSKVISSITACLLVGLLLAGCSSNNSSNNAAASGSSSPSASGSAAPSASGSAAPTASSAPSDTASASPSASAAPNEKALAPEKSPLGDIPDSQQFVKYSSGTGKYSLEVPEGWARTEQGADVSFISKLDGVQVSVSTVDNAPTVASIKPGLIKNGRAVKIISAKVVSLHNGKAIKVSFNSNSEPNSVTGKQIRQDNEAYYYYKNKQLAVLTMWAPLGADNIDQWNNMSGSFGWDTK